MISRWYESKEKAIILRRQGLSIRAIETRLKIPRSTLSGWLRNIQLSQKQKIKLQKKQHAGLVNGQEKSALWHRGEKIKRLKIAEQEALDILQKIDHTDKHLIELALAILYLGEGTKATHETAIGNSDPRILKFFLAVLKNVYKVDLTKIRCQLNLRADQNAEEMVLFWASKLGLLPSNFRHVAFDHRTKGSKTYPGYKGVCQVRLGNVAIQRRLLHLAHLFCNKVVESNLGG